MKSALALLLVLALGIAAQDRPAASPGDAEIFPMTTGTTWTYRAQLRHVGGQSELRWTVTVVDSFHRPAISAAVLQGGPWDLAWHQPHPRPRKYMVVRMDATYYLVKDGIAETLADIRAGDLRDFKNRLSDDIWFRVPLRESDVACAPEMESRAPMYCWAVEGVGKHRPMKLRKQPLADQDAYRLVFRTNPDHQIVTLVPGIGITAWEYAHHGSISEAKLELVDFRMGK